MTKTYIIQAHKGPAQLLVLINILNDSESFFYIHIDKKSNLQSFENLISKENVFFITNRVDCIWGDYSQVQATLNLIENVLANNTISNGHVIFLSGQDFPIKSLPSITNFLAQNVHSNFMRFDSFEECVSKKQKMFYKRIYRYKVNVSNKRGDFLIINPLSIFRIKDLYFYSKLLLAQKITVKDIFSKYKTHKKANFCKNKHFRGSQWWCLNHATVTEIYNFYQQNKAELDMFYSSTYCADEQFFQTIYKVLYPNNKPQDYLHYIDWNRKGVDLPVIFSKEDFGTLIQQPQQILFARKFDIEFDSEILSNLQTHLIKQ